MFHSIIKGDSFERGVQHGKNLRSLIQACVASYCRCHSNEHSEEEIKEFLDHRVSVLEGQLPELLVEMKGIAKGAEVRYEDILALNFRIWNNLYNPKRLQLTECSNIAFTESDCGPLLGGTIDDPRDYFFIQTVYPKNGYNHVEVTWAGTVWAIRGINEHGLAIGQSSSAAPVDEDEVLCSFLNYLLLERCKTVEEATEFVGQYQTGHNFTLADAAGNVAVIEAIPEKKVVRKAKDKETAIFSTNHFMAEEMSTVFGNSKVDEENSSWKRYKFLAEVARENKGRYSLELMKRTLRSHKNFPKSICNPATLCATIAVVRENKLLVADKYPCQNKFVEYVIE